MLEEKRLEYNYADLEPYIDTHTIGLHYNKHYLNYLNNLNNILKKHEVKYIDKKDLNDVLNILNQINQDDIHDALFNLGGVINHEIYFDIISPNKNDNPVGKIKDDIEKKYGDYNNFKQEILNKAKTLKGSGYTYLVKDKNNREEYINNFFEILDWNKINKNYETTLKY